ncbi:hypothetical protein DI09_5p70 [Mitosporidium daphniae]|uniref:Peptidase S54 rhomboid domain-containing protein n=1 Tax=Mitosporidium daphniae TaxID=1485682 RepID=A0A098VNW3_9MICR|nr:uncharacterized protein DI09_5p70 [Mitosporidium daphniae]KGG50660.1 hypothetical protein DI09_5p70 [Mitosporidium daphniae]|eukprot:XP_013237144.1 uncharacterized protein DI09_5p70 [Mitosporidium daphniae]
MWHSSRLKSARMSLFKSGVFCAGTIVSSFVILAYVEEQRLKNERKEQVNFWGKLQYYVGNLHSNTLKSHNAKFNNRLTWELENTWSSLTSAQKTLSALILANTAVFIGWKIPALVPFMQRHFLHSPLSSPHTLLTSSFSHSSFLHLSFNMIALSAFGGWIHQELGREQFLFMYLSAAVTSSFVSQAWKVLVGRENMLHIPSLGASGAIMSLFAATAHRKDISIGLILLPGIHVPSNVAVAGMAAVDAYCLLFRSATSRFDHAAHLGGSAFGYIYPIYIPKLLWENKRSILGFDK